MANSGMSMSKHRKGGRVSDFRHFTGKKSKKSHRRKSYHGERKAKRQRNRGKRGSHKSSMICSVVSSTSRDYH